MQLPASFFKVVSLLFGLFAVIINFALNSAKTISNISYPRLATLRRIVSTRLRSMPEFSDGNVPLLLLHQECLGVLSNLANCKIKQLGVADTGAQREWRSLISPIA